MSDITIEHIKEKLMMILNGEKTFKYINNITKPLGKDTIRGNIISGKDAVNCFLMNIFTEENAFVDRDQNNKTICDLIVYGKRILTRTTSFNKNSRFYFGCFSIHDNVNFNINKFEKSSRERINNTDYFLLIQVKRSKPSVPFDCSYKFYLVKAKDFISKDGEIDYYTRIGGSMFLYLENVENLGSPIFTYNYSIE